MHIALVIYGSLNEVSGGFLYDRKLVEHLQQRGHEVTVIPLPWRSYGRSLVDNGSHCLLRRMQGGEFAVIVQDELIHPSVFQLVRKPEEFETSMSCLRYPIVPAQRQACVSSFQLSQKEASYLPRGQAPLDGDAPSHFAPC
jgi:hypothetical protein